MRAVACCFALYLAATAAFADQAEQERKDIQTI